MQNFDVSASIAQLMVYPVKSCAGIAVAQALLTDTGLELDRNWMVVDEAGVFVSQRELPRMALIRPELRLTELLLRAPGMPALPVTRDLVGQPLAVRVWDDQVQAFDMGAVAAQWFSDFLGLRLRLVRFDPARGRSCSPKWTSGQPAQTQFADAYPLLVTTAAALPELNTRLAACGQGPVGMERFRPNIVLGELPAHDEDHLALLQIQADSGRVQLAPVKPCVRCPIPDIDPATADSSPGVGETLRSYRQDARMGGAITFGMNAIVCVGAGQLLRVGQRVQAQYRFA